MDDSLLPLAVLLALCAAAGWWSTKLARHDVKRLLLAALALPALAVGAIFVSGLLGSDTLGWLGGLSLMVMAFLAVPVGIALTIGWWFGRFTGRRPDEPAAPPPAVVPDSLRAEAIARLAARWQRQRGVLLTMAGVLAGFWVVIGLGFRLNGQAAPAIIDTGLVPAALVLLVVLALGLKALPRLLREGRAHRVADARNWDR